MNPLGFALALALLAAAGCLEGANPQTEGAPVEETSSPSAVPAAPGLPPTAGLADPGAIEATECVEGGVNTPGLAGSFGEMPPAGWERSETDHPLTFVYDWIFQCSRVAWGSFERPSFVLWELHQSFEVVDSCRRDGALHYFVGTLWFSDPDLVAQARAIGLPAFWGDFELSTSDAGDLRSWAWTWNAPNEAASSLTFTDNPPQVTVDRTAPGRFFWFTEGEVRYFDNEFVERLNQAANPVVTGSMAVPMMYAGRGVEPFLGAGNAVAESHFSGTFHRFGDLECKQPVPF